MSALDSDSTRFHLALTDACRHAPGLDCPKCVEQRCVDLERAVRAYRWLLEDTATGREQALRLLARIIGRDAAARLQTERAELAGIPPLEPPVPVQAAAEPVQVGRLTAGEALARIKALCVDDTPIVDSLLAISALAHNHVSETPHPSTQANADTVAHALAAWRQLTLLGVMVPTMGELTGYVAALRSLRAILGEDVAAREANRLQAAVLEVGL